MDEKKSYSEPWLGAESNRRHEDFQSFYSLRRIYFCDEIVTSFGPIQNRIRFSIFFRQEDFSRRAGRLSFDFRVIYRDTAVTFRLANQVAAVFGDEHDKFGGIGRNGAQQMER
jgi:hypothetical protein